MLPVYKSLFAPEALAALVSEKFGWESARCQLLNRSMRDVYRIDSGGKRSVFYVYRTGVYARSVIEAEWHIVARLAQKGVPVVTGIPVEGTTYTVPLDAPEGVRYGVLAPYIPGQHLRQRPDLKATEAYGRYIAVIHAITEFSEKEYPRPEIDPLAIVEEAVKGITDVLADQPEVVTLVRTCAEKLYPLLSAWSSRYADTCLLHGDVIRANAQVGDDGAVTILDFDLCGYGPALYDVASFLFVVRGAPHEAASVRAFLQGYESVRPLEPAEEYNLPIYEAVRALFALGVPATQVNHWGWNNLEGQLKTSLAALRDAMERIPG